MRTAIRSKRLPTRQDVRLLCAATGPIPTASMTAWGWLRRHSREGAAALERVSRMRRIAGSLSIAFLPMS